MDKETYDALYKDVICKSYCDIEVPSRVLELQHIGIGFTEAIRTVMIDRINEKFHNGELNCTLEQVKELEKDLKKCVDGKERSGSVNLRRIHSRIRVTLGMKRLPKDQATFYLALRSNRYITLLNQAVFALSERSKAALLKKIVCEWLDRHETEITEAINRFRGVENAEEENRTLPK